MLSGIRTTWYPPEPRGILTSFVLEAPGAWYQLQSRGAKAPSVLFVIRRGFEGLEAIAGVWGHSVIRVPPQSFPYSTTYTYCTGTCKVTSNISQFIDYIVGLSKACVYQNAINT